MSPSSIPSLGALATAALLTACATSAPTPVPAGATRMSTPDIQALFAQPTQLDNEVRGGLTYRFAPNGGVEFGMRLFAARKSGQWRADDEGLCVRVESDPWICGPLYRLGANRYYFDVPQYGQDYNSLTVRP